MYITTQELADILGISRNTVYRMVERKDIPCYRFMSGIRFDLEEVLAATKQEVHSDDEKA